MRFDAALRVLTASGIALLILFATGGVPPSSDGAPAKATVPEAAVIPATPDAPTRPTKVPSSGYADQGKARLALGRVAQQGNSDDKAGAGQQGGTTSQIATPRHSTPAPTTANGYQQMFDQIDPGEWGGADISISTQLPDGRNVWLYGDTLSGNNGFVHSTAIVQDGGALNVSDGGKQLLPNGPEEGDRQTVYWIEDAKAVGNNQLLLNAAPVSIGTKSVWDFERSNPRSRIAQVSVDLEGNAHFEGWRGYEAAPPDSMVDHGGDDFKQVGPGHFTYQGVTHGIRLANGKNLHTTAQNWDDRFENHKNTDGSLRFSDWAPIFSATPDAPTHATRVLAISVRARGAVSRTARWSRAINTSSLSAVNSSYLTDFASGLGVPTSFTGDESRCEAGTTSTQSRTATLRALNFVRSLAGLAPVSFSAALNSRSQDTALMMSANRQLSHSPSRDWRCYSSTGAANAGRSNLALSYPQLTSAGLVRLYTSDPGAENGAVGHRRWLLNPFATTMGSGSTRTANAITVIGPSSSARPNPRWVAWPSAGYFPNTLEPGGRWSLSSGNRAVSFSRALVRVYRNGALLKSTKQRVVNGYGQPTLVWQLSSAQAKAGTYRVAVSGIRLGHRRTSADYVVRMFTPGR